MEFKVIVLGDKNSRKNALIVKYVFGRYNESIEPTIEDNYKKEVKINEEKMILEFFVCENEFVSLRDQNIKVGNGFIVCKKKKKYIYLIVFLISFKFLLYSIFPK